MSNQTNTYITDEELRDVMAMVSAGRSVPAVIVQAILRRMQAAEGGGRDFASREMTDLFS